MPPWRQWVLWSALGWGLTACGEPAPEGKPDDSAAAARPATSDPAHPDGSSAARVEMVRGAPPTVTLLAPGAAPKAALRWSPEVGVQDSIRLAMHTSLWFGGEPMPTPPIVVDADVRVEAVTDAGVELTYTVRGIRLGDGEADDPSAVGSLLDGVGPMAAHVEMDRSGVVRAGHVDVPPSLAGPARKMVEEIVHAVAQLQVPFPPETVGVGARWSAVSSVVQGGMELQQTATYELLERDGDAVKLGVTLGHKLINPTFAPPGMTGLKAKVTMFQAGGDATVSLSTTQPLPTTMALAVKLKMAMDVAALGQTQSQDVQINTRLTLGRPEDRSQRSEDR